MSVRTTTVAVPMPEGTADALLVAPDGTGPWPGVVLYMDAFGLRPRLEEMAGRIAREGYVVLVPNVFYRSARSPIVDASALADPEKRSALFGQLRPLMAELTPESFAADAKAYLAFLTAELAVADGPMGAVGYCMGGALAIRTAAGSPDSVAAVASFHGGRLATEDPTSPHLLADRLTAEVYVGHADHDRSMPPEQQQRLAEALTEAGVTFEAELYEGAAHGFTMADTAMYDEAATDRHWDRLLALFKRALPLSQAS